MSVRLQDGAGVCRQASGRRIGALHIDAVTQRCGKRRGGHLAELDTPLIE